MKKITFTEVSSGGEGITLIETLVSMVILAAVIVSATMVFRGSLERFARQAAEKTIYSEAAAITGYMDRYLPPAMFRDGEENWTVHFEGGPYSVKFVSPFSEGEGSDLARFGIYFDRSDAAVKVAVERIDGQRPDFSFSRGFPGAQTLGESVKDFRLSYSSDAEWTENWNTASMEDPRLPSFVRVDFTVFSREIEGERIERTFSKLIRIN